MQNPKWKRKQGVLSHPNFESSATPIRWPQVWMVWKIRKIIQISLWILWKKSVSTFALFGFCLLLNHVIQLKLLAKIEQSHKMATIFTQKDKNFTWMIMNSKFSASNGIMWFNSQLKPSRANVDHHSPCLILLDELDTMIINRDDKKDSTNSGILQGA